MNPNNLHIVRRTLACLTAAGLLLSFAGCSKKTAETAVQPEEESIILVKTAKPETGDLTQATEYIGTVEPDDLVQVMPKMGGTVNGVFVEVGETVTAGQPLMSFDTTDLEVSLAAQRASVEVARASVMTAQAQVDQALGSTFDVQLAQLESALQQAKNGYASARQGLRDYNDNSVTPSAQIEAQRDSARESVTLLENKRDMLKREYDEIQAQYGNSADAANKLLVDNAKDKYMSAEADLRAAESQLSLLNANYNDDDLDTTLRNLRTSSRNAQLAYDSANTIYELTKNDVRNDALKVSNAQLGQAAASYDAQVKAYEAQAHQLTFAQVSSPIDGVIEAVNVTENQTIGTGTVTFTVTNKANLVVTFYVSEDAAKVMSLGDPVKVENGRSTYDAAISEIGTMVDASGLFKVKATLSDDVNLMSGVSVKVTASTAKAQGLLIPQSAIYYNNGQGYVYVYEDGKAVRKDIVVGVSNNELAEILEGIDGNTQLITTWNPNLQDGVPVQLSSGSSASSEPSAAPSSDSSGASSDEGSASGAADSQPDSSEKTASPEADSSTAPVGFFSDVPASPASSSGASSDGAQEESAQ